MMNVIYFARTSALILILISLSCAAASAQIRTLRWNTEFCEFSGTYNSKKHTAVQLQNTLKLLLPGEFALNFGATVWRYEDIGALNPAELDRQYAEVTDKLKSLKIVKSPYWEAVRQNKLREIEQVYRLSWVTIRAYAKPAVLRDYNEAETCRAAFAEPLIAGGDLLLRSWRKVNEESRARNADPDRLRRIFDQQNASADRLKFARVEVMSFGWWNCANNFIEYEDGMAGVSHEREFKKLFIRVRTIQCDEP